MNIEILSAEIKEDLFCQFTYTELLANRKDEVKRTPDIPVHDDLKLAFSHLIPHYIYMGEFRLDEQTLEKLINNPEILDTNEKLELTDWDEVEKFTVSKFILSGTGENQSLTLSGDKRLAHGELKINVNKVLLYAYAHEEQLIEVLEVIKNEVYQYHNGKRAPEVEERGQDLFSGLEESLGEGSSVTFTNNDGTVLNEVKGKKKGKGKAIPEPE